MKPWAQHQLHHQTRQTFPKSLQMESRARIIEENQDLVYPASEILMMISPRERKSDKQFFFREIKPEHNKKGTFDRGRRDLRHKMERKERESCEDQL